ncbi:MAG: pre-peptidase C-terminal domain-containing protein, partial [Methylococcaceae bacterium]
MTAPTLNSLIDDYANTPSDSNAPLPNLNVGDSITGVIEIGGDNDLFKVQLNAGAHYSFGVKGSDTGSGTLSDPYLTVLDSTGAVVASDDDSGIYNNALLPDFVAPSTGTYYLSASGNNLSTGSYTL